MKRRLLVVGSLSLVIALVAVAASASWMSTASGTASAAADDLVGNKPGGTVSGDDVTVSWAAATFNDGTSATGYSVQRYAASGGTVQAIGANCAGSVSGTSCIEQDVPVGSWQYTVTPTYAGWTGTESPKSDTVVVAPLDATAPSLTTLQMFDGTNAADANGKVDRVVATFSETLAAYTAGTTPWTLLNVPSGGSLSSVAVSGTTATLTLTEGASAADTSVGSFTISLSANPNGIRDAAGNMSSFAATAPADKASPFLASLEMFDGTNAADANGKVDRVVATFSEVLASSTATAGVWATANVPSGGSLSSVATSGAAATLTLTEGTGAKDTAVGTFTVTLTAAAAGIRDAADNRSSFAARAPSDKAAPVVVSLTLGNNSGGVAKNDSVGVVYSEKLSVSSLCSAWSTDDNPQALESDSDNLKITVANNASNDQLTVASTSTCTFNFGQVGSGGNYVTSSVDFGPDTGGNRSTITWTASSKTLLITLGRITGTGTVAANVPATPAPTTTYTPSTSIKDPAGNAMAATVFSVSGQRF